MALPVVSLDVGGTLGHVDGPSLPAMLVKASPLDGTEARSIVRQRLHTQTEITAAVIIDICDALWIPVDAFPRCVAPAPLRLVPDAKAALSMMWRHAHLVTLSNVTCLEKDTDHLDDLLKPWGLDHFPSCRIGYAKPDPAAFQYVADACDTSTANMVHIGDDWTCDVVGARSAGVTAIWISNGRAVPEPARSNDPGILVAVNLLDASRHVATFAPWR